MPSSIELLSGLAKCYLKDCERLESLPSGNFNLKSLKFLSLSGYSKLGYFPVILKPLECLLFLHLDGAGIKELSSSIENLSGLNELRLDTCKNLEVLPESISEILNTIEYNYSCCVCSKHKMFRIELVGSFIQGRLFRLANMKDL